VLDAARPQPTSVDFDRKPTPAGPPADRADCVRVTARNASRTRRKEHATRLVVVAINSEARRIHRRRSTITSMPSGRSASAPAGRRVRALHQRRRWHCCRSGIGYALVWTVAPERDGPAGVAGADFGALQEHFGDRVSAFTAIAQRRVSAVASIRPQVPAGARWCWATQRKPCIPSPGRANLGLRDVWSLAQALLDTSQTSDPRGNWRRTPARAPSIAGPGWG
jgi:hypothetical protein